MVNLEEEYLIKKLQGKDETAFEVVVEKYGDRLLKVCYMILKDIHLSQDIVQEVFIQIFNNIDSFKGNSSLYTWIYKIAINRCRNVLKKESRMYVTDEVYLDIDSCNDDIDKNINMIVLKDIILKLKPNYREVITLYYLEDMSLNDISEVTGENENTIKTWLLRGRNLIKNYMIKEGFSDGKGQIG